MARFQRTRELYKFLKNPKRYSSQDGESVDLDETADPSTWRDTTTPTLGERLASRRRQLSAFAFLGFVLFAMVAVYSQRFFPGLYGNVWLQRALIVVVAVPTIFIAGVRWWRGQLEKIDWFVMIGPESGVRFYLGKFDPHDEPTFQPLKGFVWAGLRGRKLQLRDLGDDLARQWANRGRSPDDPADIRVADARWHSKETFMGTIVGVVTSGLEIDGKGRDSDLYCAPPEMVDEETYQTMTRKLVQTNEEVADLQERNSSLKEQRDSWKRKAKKNRDEVEEDLVGLLNDVGEAVDIGADRRRGRGSRSTDREQNGSGQYPMEGDQ